MPPPTRPAPPPSPPAPQAKVKATVGIASISVDSTFNQQWTTTTESSNTYTSGSSVQSTTTLEMQCPRAASYGTCCWFQAQQSQAQISGAPWNAELTFTYSTGGTNTYPVSGFYTFNGYSSMATQVRGGGGLGCRPRV